MKYWGDNLIKQHFILIILLFYFLTHLINLTLLPIFNDEAIYLYWGWIETHVPGMLYYSLFDSKPPLLMWLFGISETVFADPLFAGRLISVLTGAITLLGIYQIAKAFFSTRLAIIASSLYSIIPIFVFFDRQALMESAVGAVGVWSCYFALKLWTTNHKKYAYFLGILLGIGLYIKYSVAIFIETYTILAIVIWWKEKQKKESIKQVATVLITIFVITFLLIINPQFLSTLPRNSQYSLTFSELLRFPIYTWVGNIIGNLTIGFFYFTPLIFIAVFAGAIIIFKERKRKSILLLSWAIVCILLQILVSRGTTVRYLESYLPLLIIPAAYTFKMLIDRKKINGLIIFFASAVIPLILTFMILFAPAQYILLQAKTNPYSQIEYLAGFPSGYGINEVVNYLKSISEKQKIFVGFAGNTGNPEDALYVYFVKNDQAIVNFLDSRQFGDSLNSVDCLSLPVKTYFISRNDELAGMDRFLSLIKTVKNPYSNYYIGVYTLKEPCHGKSVYLNTIQ